MIYLGFALHVEAKEYLESLKLKKNLNYNYLEVYEQDNITILIFGIGVLNAIKKLSRFFSNINLSKNDIFINIGLTGSNKYKIGEVILANKILYHDFVIYPDIIGKYQIKEETLVSKDKVTSNLALVDMEGYGILYALKDYFYLNNIYILKVVSDNKEKKILTEVEITNLIKNTKPSVEEIIKKEFLNKEVFIDYSFLTKAPFTNQMLIELKKRIRYLVLNDDFNESLVESMIDNAQLKNKSDLKKLYENILEVLNV